MQLHHLDSNTNEITHNVHIHTEYIQTCTCISNKSSPPSTNRAYAININIKNVNNMLISYTCMYKYVWQYYVVSELAYLLSASDVYTCHSVAPVT